MYHMKKAKGNKPIFSLTLWDICTASEIHVCIVILYENGASQGKYARQLKDAVTN